MGTRGLRGEVIKGRDNKGSRDSTWSVGEMDRVKDNPKGVAFNPACDYSYHPSPIITLDQASRSVIPTFDNAC